MDVVFDALANGRRVKTPTVVDDCSKEAVQIAVDTLIPALYVTRVLDQVKAERGLPKVIRTTTAPSSPVGRCSSGPSRVASSCASFSRASPFRTPTSRGSTAASETS
jgi:transposase InsO family protein